MEQYLDRHFCRQAYRGDQYARPLLQEEQEPAQANHGARNFKSIFFRSAFFTFFFSTCLFGTFLVLNIFGVGDGLRNGFLQGQEAQSLLEVPDLNSREKQAEEQIAKRTTAPDFQIWIIRHGEKDKTGNPSLNAQGKQRAQNIAKKVKTGEWPEFSAVYAARRLCDHQDNVCSNREFETAQPISEVLNLTINDQFYRNTTYFDTFHGKNMGHISDSIFNFLLEDDKNFKNSSNSKQEGIHEKESVDIENKKKTLTEKKIIETHKKSVVLVSWDHALIPGLLRSLGCKDPRCDLCWTNKDFDSVVKLRVEPGENKGSNPKIDLIEGLEQSPLTALNVIGSKRVLMNEALTKIFPPEQCKCRMANGTVMEKQLGKTCWFSKEARGDVKRCVYADGSWWQIEVDSNGDSVDSVDSIFEIGKL